MKSPDAKIIHADLEKHTNDQIKAEAPKPKIAEVIKDRILKTERLSISELVPFQGEAKKLSDKNFNKLRKSILDEGFSFTVHVWEHGGKKFIIDGHQRIHVMRQLEKQGYILPEINCAFVSAKTFKQAKKLVMLAISQYGKLDREGFFDFIGEDDFDFDDFDFPDFKLDDDKDIIPDEVNEDIKGEFLIVLEFEDETEQSAYYEELSSRGVKCKIM